MGLIKAIDQHAVDTMEQFITDLPPHMRDGVRAYVLDGKRSGGFLMSVLENDFAGAVKRADMTNTQMLVNWADFLNMGLMSSMWGSKGKVEAWLESGGLRGQLRNQRDPEPAYPKKQP